MGLFGKKKSLYERIGGQEAVVQVHRIFYGKIFGHPWISKYFSKVDRDFIEGQQTAFMTGLMGGPKAFKGKPPHLAHSHIFATPELFELRQHLLRLSLNQAGVSRSIAMEWLALDSSFSSHVVKTDQAQCLPKENIGILSFSNPMSDPAELAGKPLMEILKPQGVRPSF